MLMLKNGLTVAIMQPYFVPYAGYFRLFAATDIFVLYDCVQFPRRGWVHRNRLADTTGALQWLTVPLAKAPQKITIQHLQFRRDAREVLGREIRRFPALTSSHPDPHGLRDALEDVTGTPVDYIERLLHRSVSALGLPWRTLRSSSLGIPPDVTGQERILAITAAVGGKHYVNPPGGRELYDPARFASAGVELRFLPPYQGSFESILARLLSDPAEMILAEMQANQHLVS